MNIEPFGKRIYIEPSIKQSIIVSDLKNKVEKGIVKAVGDAVEKIKVGDQILFTNWGIDKFEDSDEVYYFILESDEYILAKVGVQSEGVAT